MKKIKYILNNCLKLVLIYIMLLLNACNSTPANSIDYGYQILKNGKRMVKGVLIDKKKEGIWIEYREDGTIGHQLIFKNNKQVGPTIFYYGLSEGGVAQIFEADKQGKKNGLCLYYHKNGNLEAMGEFRDDWKIGIWKYYYSDKVLQRITKYENKKPIYLFRHEDDKMGVIRE